MYLAHHELESKFTIIHTVLSLCMIVSLSALLQCITAALRVRCTHHADSRAMPTPLFLIKLAHSRHCVKAHGALCGTSQHHVSSVCRSESGMQGSLISSMLIFLVLFVGYVWEQVRLYWTTRQVELRWEQERHHQPILPQARHHWSARLRSVRILSSSARTSRADVLSAYSLSRQQLPKACSTFVSNAVTSLWVTLLCAHYIVRPH